MARYHRRGHWRAGKNGSRHWVSGHSVTRSSGWGGGWGSARRPLPPARRPSAARSPRPVAPPRLPAVTWSTVPTEPNATCPRCGARVWFFRNKYGGCAYFDSLGWPWPKHPCLPQTSDRDLRAARQAKLAYDRVQARLGRAAARARRRQQKRQPVAEPPRLRLSKRVSGEQHDPGRVSAVAPHPGPRSEESTTTIAWWLVLSALLAWIESLPLSVYMLVPDPEHPVPTWVLGWLVVFPTLLLLPAMARFLRTVPRTPPSLGKVAAVIVGSPLLLTLAIIANTVTLGLGLPLLGIGPVASSPPGPVRGRRRRERRPAAGSLSIRGPKP